MLKNDLLLHEAVIKNDTDAVRRVLRDHVDVDSRNNVSGHDSTVQGVLAFVKFLTRSIQADQGNGNSLGNVSAHDNCKNAGTWNQ